MSTTKHNKRNRKIAAIALVAVGVAGLGAASASQLTVNPSDDVASGVGATVTGISGASATVKTVLNDADGPDAGGAVTVDLGITLSGYTGNAAGTVYVAGLSQNFTVTGGAVPNVAIAGLDSHDAIGNVAIVLTKTA